MNDALESRMLVRMYSWEVEERLPPGSAAHPLAQTLIEDRGDRESVTAPWRKFFEPQELSQNNCDPLADIIAVESAKLRGKWETFQNNCPRDERLELNRSEPTAEGVVDMVQEMAAAWRSKREKGRRGKAMKLFHSFCSSLDSHKSLMKLLPEGNAYVSVFMGSLGAIIKASVNHETIAEEFASSLCRISEHITKCRAELELFRTEYVLKSVVDLYAHIFLYFSSVMDWITEKRHRRMLDSFNENLSKRFNDEIAEISRKAETLRWTSEYSSQVEIRAMRLGSEQRDKDMRIGLDGIARHLAERQYFEERLVREFQEARRDREESRGRWTHLSGRVNRLLTARAMEAMQTNQTVYIPLELADAMDQGVDSISPVITTQWSSDKVSLTSKGLEDTFHRERVRLPVDATEPIMLNQEALVGLSEWAESGAQPALWLSGPNIDADDLDNPISVLAARIIDLAARSQVPVISYFCELRRNERLRAGNPTIEVQALLSLVYALTRQLVELLLPQFDAAVDLSETRFSRLDGTAASWAEAVAVFRDLIRLSSDRVLCVIDGFHWLDDRSTDVYLGKFLGLLREGKLRVVLTTTGRSACLRDEVSGLEMVEVKVGRPGDGNRAFDDVFIGSV